MVSTTAVARGEITASVINRRGMIAAGFMGAKGVLSKSQDMFVLYDGEGVRSFVCKGCLFGEGRRRGGSVSYFDEGVKVDLRTFWLLGFRFCRSFLIFRRPPERRPANRWAKLWKYQISRFLCKGGGSSGQKVEVILAKK